MRARREPADGRRGARARGTLYNEHSGIRSQRMKHTILVVVGAAAVVAAQPARRSVALVVVGGTVITQDAVHRVVAPGAVAIAGTDIVDVDTPAAIAGKYNANE